MSIQTKSMLWAAAIIAFAFIANGRGLSDELSLIIVLGMAGAATTHLYAGRRRECAKGAGR